MLGSGILGGVGNLLRGSGLGMRQSGGRCGPGPGRGPGPGCPPGGGLGNGPGWPPGGGGPPGCPPGWWASPAWWRSLSGWWSLWIIGCYISNFARKPVMLQSSNTAW